MFTQAIARKPGKNFAQGLTTAVSAKPPQYELLLKQHETYLETLKSCGLDVTILDPLPDYPDAYFVEDTAVVTPDVAVITNPGAEARKGEEESMAPVLAGFRKIERILAPGTVDGGDVLQVDNHFFIGLSERTNKEGAATTWPYPGKLLATPGPRLRWEPDCILNPVSIMSAKTHCSLQLISPNMRQLSGYDKIVVEKAEAYAANTLLVNGHLLTPAGFPGTRKQLEVLGFEIIELETSEVRKMDGGLTCMSIRF